MAVRIKMTDTGEVITLPTLYKTSDNSGFEGQEVFFIATPCGHKETEPGYENGCSHLACALEIATINCTNESAWRLVALFGAAMAVIVGLAGESGIIFLGGIVLGAAGLFLPESAEEKRKYLFYKDLENFVATQVNGRGVLLGRAAVVF